MGLESIYFLNNLGSLAIVLAFKILLILLWLLMKPFARCSKRCRRKRKGLGRYIFWNSWISVISESLIIVVLCGLIQINSSIKIESWGQKVHYYLCISILAVYIMMPLVFFAKVLCNFKDNHKKEMKATYGALYRGKAIKRGRKVLLQPISYFLRRLLVVYLVQNVKYRFCQITLTILLTLVTANVTNQTKAFERRVDSRRSNFAELAVLLNCYCFLNFDILTAEQNFNLGYVSIGVLCLYIGLNLLLLVTGTITLIKRKL